METQTNTNTQPVEATPAATNNNPHETVNKLWPVVVGLMVVALIALAVFGYARRSMVNTPQQSDGDTTTTQETSMTYMDEEKDEETVNNELLLEIEELEKTDVQATFDATQMDDLKE
jgi:cytochrome c-type biogenesis protein CcmH/NrfG